MKPYDGSDFFKLPEAVHDPLDGTGLSKKVLNSISKYTYGSTQTDHALYSYKLRIQHLGSGYPAGNGRYIVLYFSPKSIDDQPGGPLVQLLRPLVLLSMALTFFAPYPAAAEDAEGNRILTLEFTTDEVIAAGSIKLRINTDEATTTLYNSGDSIESEVVPDIVDLVNDSDGPFADSEFVAEVDPDNAKRIIFKQKDPDKEFLVRSFRVEAISRREDDPVCIPLKPDLDPPSVGLGFALPAFVAEGTACHADRASRLFLNLNNETIEVPLSLGVTRTTLLDQLTTTLEATGFTLLPTTEGLIITAMPDGSQLKRIGIQTDDAAVLGGGIRLFEVTALEIPTISWLGIGLTVLLLALGGLYLLHR